MTQADRMTREQVLAKIGSTSDCHDGWLESFRHAFEMLAHHAVHEAPSVLVNFQNRGRWFLTPTSDLSVGAVEVVELTHNSIIVHGDCDAVIVKIKGGGKEPGDLILKASQLIDIEASPSLEDFVEACERGLSPEAIRTAPGGMREEDLIASIAEYVKGIEDRDIANAGPDLVLVAEEVRGDPDLNFHELCSLHCLDDLADGSDNLGMRPGFQVAHAAGAILRVAQHVRKSRT